MPGSSGSGVSSSSVWNDQGCSTPWMRQPVVLWVALAPLGLLEQEILSCLRICLIVVSFNKNASDDLSHVFFLHFRPKCDSSLHLTNGYNWPQEIYTGWWWLATASPKHGSTCCVSLCETITYCTLTFRNLMQTVENHGASTMATKLVPARWEISWNFPIHSLVHPANLQIINLDEFFQDLQWCNVTTEWGCFGFAESSRSGEKSHKKAWWITTKPTLW